MQTGKPLNRIGMTAVASGKEPENFAHTGLFIGIGAYEGGLAAFETIIKRIQSPPEATFFLIPQLTRSYVIDFAGVLKKYTILPVEYAHAGATLVKNRIYVPPADKIITLENGRIRLQNPDEFDDSPSRIDLFFESLAGHYTDRVVGILLSGKGEDGCKGLQAVKRNGGLTIVQEPKSAKYNEMVRHAIEKGSADFILKPENIFGWIDKTQKGIPEKSVAKPFPNISLLVDGEKKDVKTKKSPSEKISFPKEIKHSPAPNNPAGDNMECLHEASQVCGLVLDENNEVVYFYGDSAQWLKHPHGKASLNIFDMTDGDLRIAIEQAIINLRTQNAESGIKINAGKGQRVKVAVRNMADDKNFSGLRMLTLENVAKKGNKKSGQAAITEIYDNAFPTNAGNRQKTAGTRRAYNDAYNRLSEELMEIRKKYESLMLLYENETIRLIEKAGMAAVVLDKENRIVYFTHPVKKILPHISSDLGKDLSSQKKRPGLGRILEKKVKVARRANKPVTFDFGPGEEDTAYRIRIIPVNEARGNINTLFLLFE